MAVAGNKLTALIVEDDGHTLAALREHLERANFHVRSAANGWEAIKSVRGGPVDVVIMELTIADTDGASLREKFLLDPGTRDVPFLFLMAEGQSEKQVRVLRLGVDDCVPRPFDPLVFVARVQAVLTRRRMYEEMMRVDPLTRVLNRASVEREVTVELARVARYERFGSLVLLDLDDMDVVNKEHGQALGDLLLACLGGIILSNIRSADIVGRQRNAEFLLYLPETRKQRATVLLRRIHDRFASVADAMAGMKAGFSVGLVETPTDGGDLAMLCERAEQAMLEAKRNGKGSVVVWEQALENSLASAGTA